MEKTPVPPAQPVGDSLPEPTATSKEAEDYVLEMQRACAQYDTQTVEGKTKVQEFLSRKSPEERQRLARRILIDLMQGKTAGSDTADASAAPKRGD